MLLPKTHSILEEVLYINQFITDLLLKHLILSSQDSYIYLRQHVV